MNIIRYKKVFLGISIALSALAIAVIALRGVDYGIEFTGGAVLEVNYTETVPAVDDLKAALVDLGYEASVQPFGDTGYIIKTPSLTEVQRKELLTQASTLGVVSVERFNSIGPSVGKELRTKSLYALIAVSLGIVFFVGYAFRKVSEPVASWKYGLVAVIALLHDIIIPVGILTLIGVEIDTLYVVGLLSILGLSVNDTLVVFDRIRESLGVEGSASKKKFDAIVGGAVKQTVTRSILTSLTLVVVLVALYLMGPEPTRVLALVLLLGTLVGTYSSIFLASPLLTLMVNKNEKKDA